jgi:hypothetical protein
MPKCSRNDDRRYLLGRDCAGGFIVDAGSDGLIGAGTFFGFFASLLPRCPLDMIVSFS